MVGKDRRVRDSHRWSHLAVVLRLGEGSLKEGLRQDKVVAVWITSESILQVGGSMEGVWMELTGGWQRLGMLVALVSQEVTCSASSGEAGQ